jgi:hypothetical protein
MTTLPFHYKDREWLETLQQACKLPPQDAPHIGPPALTQLVNALLAQDEELLKLRERRRLLPGGYITCPTCAGNGLALDADLEKEDCPTCQGSGDICARCGLPPPDPVTDDDVGAPCPCTDL